MKTLFFIPLLLISSVTALTLPTEETRRDTSTYYFIGENELGTVYSTIKPTEKRQDSEWYAISTNEHGTVYSSIKPSSVKRDESGVSSLADYQDWMAKQALTSRELSEVEKRLTNYEALYNCMALCGTRLAAATGDTMSYRVQYCLQQCGLQMVISYYSRAKYMDQYPDSFPPADNLAG
ncbi:uncharacterized protein EAF02_000916 [Botrytis sinoallii]|uniref:uncharacterized protein n=1 Tax=Botrytis sinoallii TaxID=1463999 RepID=UPI0018FFA41A|nr:uncharacterized protein EAF02_000916 [Botrytis sinoallii]KAF7893378.1 hypothetical protein EAF02_000916 [Botrytis sinoallii]